MRLAELVANIFRARLQPRQLGGKHVELTERGMRYVLQRLAQGLDRINQEAPVQAMVKSEGWRMVEREIADDIIGLWMSALDKLASPDPAVREQAQWDAVMAHTLNQRVLHRVSGKMLDALLLRSEIMTFTNVKDTYLKQTENPS